MSIFNGPNSASNILNHQTSKLSTIFTIESSLLDRLSKICAIVVKHFIHKDDYNFRVEDGSLTFQHKNLPNRVIKIFVDLDNKISSTNGINTIPHPIVVGVELSKDDPFISKAIREEIRVFFGNDCYLDPDRNFPMYTLKPQYEHVYDLIILKPGPTCAYEQADYVYYKNEIINELKLNAIPELETLTTQKPDSF